MIGIYQWKEITEAGPVYKFVKVEYAITDVVALPEGVPPDSNWI